MIRMIDTTVPFPSDVHEWPRLAAERVSYHAADQAYPKGFAPRTPLAGIGLPSPFGFMRELLVCALSARVPVQQFEEPGGGFGCPHALPYDGVVLQCQCLTQAGMFHSGHLDRLDEVQDGRRVESFADIFDGQIGFEVSASRENVRAMNRL
jgi:hypothetical protein